MTVMPILDFLPEVSKYFIAPIFVFLSFINPNPNKDNSNCLKINTVYRSNLIRSPFQPVKLFVSKETILKLLNIDFMKVNTDDIHINIEDEKGSTI